MRQERLRFYTIKNCHLDSFLQTKEMRRVDLTEKSWLELDTIPYELLEYGQDNFEELFALHPEERGQVILNKQETIVIDSPRYHKSYGQTPPYDPIKKHSYMFTGLNNQDQRNDPLPALFQPFLDFVNENNPTPYNQVVVNWYANGEDYIACHSDCDDGMVDGYDIASITLMGRARFCEERTMKFKPVGNSAKFDSFSLGLKNGLLLRMCGNTQKEFKHSIPPRYEIVGDMRRIGITFRKFKV